MEVENLLHQAYVDQLQGNIDGCLTKQVQAMSILEDAKSHCSEEELPALSLKLDNIASEFNMIRSMHPEVEVQIHAEPEAPVASSGDMSPRQETATESFTQSQAVPTPSVTPDNSFMATVNQTCNEVFTYIKEMNEKYHVSEEIKESVEKGKQNVTEFFSGDVKEKVKEGYNNVASWMKEHHVAEKAAYGVKCVLCIVIKGVVVSTQFIAKSVKEIIAKNKENAAMQANSNGVVIPPTENPTVFPQPVPAAAAPTVTPITAPTAAPTTAPSAGSAPASESLPMATPVPPEVVAQLSSSPRN